jgi:N utilization substance protein B
MSRYKAREAALKAVFLSQFQDDLKSDEIISIYCENAEAEKSLNELSTKSAAATDEAGYIVLTDLNDMEFFESTVKGVIAHREELDKIIGSYSIGWNIDRISKISTAILRVALYEIIHLKDMPVSVSVNEAVEFSKRYDTKESSAFINGILGSYLKAEGRNEKKENDEVPGN